MWGRRQPPLEPEQAEALGIIPGWRWEENASWERRRSAVMAFQATHGRLPRACSTPGRPYAPSEELLGKWCYRQRLQKRGTRKPALTPGQLAALEAIPGWWWERAGRGQQPPS